jgi:4-hydroxybenzoate polyprenyltransferase
LAGYRFLFLLPNAIASDLPDRRGDELAGIRTAASRFGARHILRLSMVVWLVLAVGLLVVVTDMTLDWVLVEEGGILVSAVAVHSWRESRKLVYRKLVDGALLWFTLVGFAVYLV